MSDERTIEGEPFVPASKVHQLVIYGEENAKFTTRATLHHNDLVSVLTEIVGDTDNERISAAQKVNIIRTRASFALERLAKGEPRA